MKRANFSKQDISLLRSVINELFHSTTSTSFDEKLEKVKDELYDNPQVKILIDFIIGESKRSFCKSGRNK